MYRFPNNGWTYSIGSARELIRQAYASAAELRKDFDKLPNTAPDGSSQCPFSEELFFRKERTTQFVRDDLQELRKFLKESTERIAKLENRRYEHAHEREALNGKEAQDRFADAEWVLLAQIRDHQSVRKELLEAIAELEATVREAGSRRFPGGDPRGHFGEPVHSEPQRPRPLDEITRDNARDEIERVKRITKDL